MSNIVPTNLQVPAHLASRIGQPSALAQSLAGGISGGSDYPRISIKGSRFRIVEGGDETVLDTTALNVVIVGANPKLSKTWYAKQWTPDAEPSAPDCFSLDGISPHHESTMPQNNLCASCPQNAWGSKTNPQTGKQIKACSDLKRLAVVSADDPEGPIYLLQVTPAALKGLNSYQKELAMRGIAPEIVTTRVTFDTDASFPKLNFGFGGFLDVDTMTAVDKLFNSNEVKLITGEMSTPARIEAPAEQPKPTVARVAKAAPAAPVDEAPFDVDPAPAAAAPKRGFGKTASAAPAPAAARAVKANVQVASSNIADDIAALVANVNADDAG